MNVSDKKNAMVKKQGGFVLTTELVMIVTVMVTGMIIGLVTMRDAVTAEMEDVAEAIGHLDQSYAFDGLRNAELTAAVEGSGFVDGADVNAGDLSVFEFIATDYDEDARTNQLGGSLAAQAASDGAESAVDTGSL